MPPEIAPIFEGVEWLLCVSLAAVVAVVAHVVFAILLATIAGRTNTRNSWMSWFPVLNVFLACNIGRTSLLWAFLVFVPCLAPIAVIAIGMGMAKQRGVGQWTGLLAVVPVLNFFWLMYLAYGPGGKFSLIISWNIYRLARGTRLLARDIPSLTPRSSSMIIAEVCPIPGDDANLGLKNLSGTSWWVMSTGVGAQEINPDEILFLKPGVNVQFGDIGAFVETTPVASSWPRRIGGILMGGLAACMLLVPIYFSAFDVFNFGGSQAPQDNRPSEEEIRQWETELRNLPFSEF